MDLLEEAKRRYPKGTKFMSLVTGRERIVSSAMYGESVENPGGIMAGGNFVYKDGRWAEITYLPDPWTSKQLTDLSDLINSIQL